ncbi:unnamed protein product [Effrenium voratum]|nr:unnamed protein product [Effrenium voratum]
MFQAEKAAETEFRDAEGYNLVGACCSLDTCGLRDFLPFICRCCGRKFCQDHADPEKHACPASVESRGMLASICQCGATVKFEDRPGAEEEAMAAHQKVCRSQPEPARELCPAEGCRKKLTAMNSVVCTECKTKVCLKHRFEDQHPCRESKGQWLARLSKPATNGAVANGAGGCAPKAQNWGSGASGRRSEEPEAAKDAKEFGFLGFGELQKLRAQLGGTEEQKANCLQTLRKLLSNVAADPTNEKFRTVKRENKAIKEKILDVPGGEELMKGLGFIDAESSLQLPAAVRAERIQALLRLVLP